MSLKFFNLLGISADIRFGAFEQMASQMTGGKLDGVAIAAGFPDPGACGTGRQAASRFRPASSEQTLHDPQQIPGNLAVNDSGRNLSFSGPQLSYGLGVQFCDCPQGSAGRVHLQAVKAVFDNHEELMKSQPWAKETIPANIDRNTMLPLHPGALLYYREAGIAVPPGAVVGN